jgi:RNA polymerase sigma factor (sigma-70 family)
VPAQERVVDLTVGGDVQPETHMQQDADAAARYLPVDRQGVADAGTQAPEPLPEAAGYQIVVGDIPRQPAGFRPRPHLMRQLDQPGQVVSVLTGVRGAGKSQLAAAYARAKLAGGWRLVAWVNGADTASLLAGLAAVADAVGLTDDDSVRGIAAAGAVIRHRLETDGDGCLLVFDDVSDPEVLKPFIPIHGIARVLITSTRESAARLGSSVRVDVLSAEEASAFLHTRTGLDDDVEAAAVAAVLGHRPLPLALAAPVIAGQRAGYAWYLDRLRAIPTDVSLTEDDGQPYPPDLVRAVHLSLQAVWAADHTGVCTRVMEIMAVLSAAGVRHELLHFAGQAGMLASGWRRAPAALVDRVLEWLSDRSLLTSSLDGQTIIMPRLVTQVIRDGLARRQRWVAVCKASAFGLEAYAVALARSQDRPAVRDIPRQVTALLENTAGLAEEIDDELAESLLRLQFIALYHLIELGDSASQAIAVGEPLTADLEQWLGPEHPDTLNSQNSLAAAYLAAGRPADAIPLFERTLAGRQRLLGPDHPDTLTSQNNLAAAYQDAGRPAEAIPLFDQPLAVRERLLGGGHPSTLTSQGNLARAYQDGGRAAEAIPLLERALVGRERVLGPDHPDTRTARMNLARAYQDGGRAAEAIPLLERALVGRERVPGPGHPDTRTARNLASTFQNRGGAEATSQVEETASARGIKPPADPAGRVSPASFRRPPATTAGRVFPVSLRRPPASPVRRPFPDGIARPSPELSEHPSTSRTQGLPRKDAHDDREVVAAIIAGDLAGIAKAYDRFAASLYGYCHWMLHGSAETAEALQDTFVIATVKISDLPEPSRLRSWLFNLARSECRRRIRTTSAARDEEADAANRRTAAVDQSLDAADWLMDATMPMPVIRPRPEAAREVPNATMPFRVVSRWPDAALNAADATMPMPVMSQWRDAAHEAADATMPFRKVSQPIDPTDGMARVNRDPGQVELRTLIASILAELRPREREVIELSFRHELYDDDLAIALGVSSSRAHALASRARGRLEKALDALLVALTRRDACPALGELLAAWDGRLTKRTRNLVGSHIVQCLTCASHGHGALRPAAFTRLLPLAPLPPQLRKQVLNRCSSAAEDAMAYRLQVAQRAESTWFASVSEAVRWRWESVRANPGAAIAAVAVAVWALAAVSVALLTVTGSNPAHAQTAPPSARPSSRPPGTAVATTAPAVASTSVAARPSRSTRPSPAYVPPVYTPSASPTVRAEPSPSPSRSPKPSKSPTPSPSRSGSPSPSPSGSPSPSKTP